MKRINSCLAVSLLLAAFAAGAADTGRSESTGQYMDDATITTKVKSALVQDPKVSAMDVKVETYRGTVQLSGFASSQDEIDRAVSLARSVSGVTEVKNDLRLKPPQ